MRSLQRKAASRAVSLAVFLLLSVAVVATQVRPENAPAPDAVADASTETRRSGLLVHRVAALARGVLDLAGTGS